MKARGRSALAKLSVPLVWRYGRDLTEDAKRGRLDPVIGREEEFTRLIQILGRKTKNNPVLIGKSGVGKTAIVEGLAQRIAEGAVPPALQGKRLVSLDLASMLAGARIRGEFEERLKSALALIATSKGEFVLLIDELHMIVGTSNLRQEPKDFFRPEFVNRIDEIVRFRALTPDDLSQIVGIQLRHLAERAADIGITLEVDQPAEAWLAARGYDPEYGARPLRRVIQRELSDRLAVLLLDGTFHEGDTVRIGVADDQLSFR